MRISYISASELPSRAANSVHVMRMCAAWARAGHNVVLYARRGAASCNSVYGAYGVESDFDIEFVKRLPVRGIGAVTYALGVATSLTRRIAKSAKPELIYGRHIYSLARLTKLNLPIAYEAHTPPRNRLQQQLEGWLFKQACFRRLIVISRALRNEYLRLFPDLPSEKLDVAHDAADLRVNAEKRLREVTGPIKAAGYVGQLYAGKGMEIVLELAALLPSIAFHIVGGSETEIAMWQRKSRARNVTFHGHQSHGSLSRYFDKFDVLLAPYQRRVAAFDSRGDIASWMSPLKLFEYMAECLPIVVSDLPVLREILAPDINALMPPPDDVNAWRTAIEKLSADPQLRSRLASRAHQDLIANFTWSARAEKVLAGIAR